MSYYSGMNGNHAQNLLAANCGTRRVTLGFDDEAELRALSDARALTCPGCGAAVVLHAGRVRARHFAHLPGAVCRTPQSEPETEEHRAGKLLLARWLRECLPEAEILIEAWIEATGQRADVLAILPGRGRAKERRFAFEFQCANLSAREWRRRHSLYREAGYEDLWILGGSRLKIEAENQRNKQDEQDRSGFTGFQSKIQNLKSKIEQHPQIRTSDLERGLFWDSAPLLFLDSVDAADGTRTPETLTRFRPDSESQAARLTGKFSAKNLRELPFPESLFDWPAASRPDAPNFAEACFRSATPENPDGRRDSDGWLWAWLEQRHRATPANLPSFFGLPLQSPPVFACAPAAWQAAIYFRFAHRRVGDGWHLPEVELWARSYLPLNRPTDLGKLRRALSEYQEILGAAGMLSLPTGYGRLHARVLADLTTLPAPPDPDETLKLARYRRTLVREAVAQYQAVSAKP